MITPLVKKFYMEEMKHTLLGLFAIMLAAAPAYVAVFKLTAGGYLFFFAGLGFGIILAALADIFLIWRMLNPVRAGSDETKTALLKNIPVKFSLRVLLSHTFFITVIPGLLMLFRINATNVFSIGDVLIFILINTYLCIGHSIARFFLSETIVKKTFMPLLDTRELSVSRKGSFPASIKQKIMLTFFLLGMLPLAVITSTSWYKLSSADLERAAHHLAGSTRDIALAGDDYLRREDYRYPRSLPGTMNRHLLLLDGEGKILYSNREPVILDLRRLVGAARQEMHGWLYWDDVSALIGYSWTPDGKTLVVQAVHTREVVLSMEYIQWIIVALAGIGILMALAIGYFASRYLSQSTRLLVEGMDKVNRGDFSTRVFYLTSDEFAILGKGFNKMVSGLAARESAIKELTAGLEEKVRLRTMELEKAYNELKQTQRIIEDELELARKVQQSFLPESPPQAPGWAMRAWASPAREVGGDLYDFIHLGDGKIGIAVGDVSGKSVPAALMMAVSLSVLHTATAGIHFPGQALNHLNQLLTGIMPPRMFLTMTYAVLDLESKCCRIANAGGPVPLLIDPRAGSAEYVDITGLPLGVFPEAVYEEFTINLSPSDMLLFYSDGLVESVDEKGEFFGFSRLQDCTSTAFRDLDDLFERLFGMLGSFTGEAAQYDDITLVSLQRLS